MKVCAYVKHDGLECVRIHGQLLFERKITLKGWKCKFKVFVPLIESFITEQ